MEPQAPSEIRDKIRSVITQYIDKYRTHVILTDERLTFERFIANNTSNEAKEVEELAEKSGIHLENLLNFCFENSDNVTPIEAITLSEIRDLNNTVRENRQKEIEARLTDGDYLFENYPNIIADPSLTDYEKAMFITLLSAGTLTVDNAEITLGTLLSGYIGRTEPTEGSADNELNLMSPAIIDKMPPLFESLVKNKFTGVISQRGYFTGDDDRLDYFIKVLDDIARLKFSFSEGSFMHKVYCEVEEIANSISTLTVPGAKKRIRNPEIKSKDLEAAIQKIERRKTYSCAKAKELMGSAWPYIEKELAGDRIKGEDLYHSVTVSFPGIHQLIGIHNILKKERVLIADMMGTGKTAQAVLAIPAIGQKEKRKVRSLVVCPYSMMGEWRRRFKEYLTSNSKYRNAFVVSSHDDLDTLEQRLGGPEEPRVVIINYAKLSRNKVTEEAVRNYFENNEDAEFEALVAKKYSEFVRAGFSFENLVNFNIPAESEIKPKNYKEAVRYIAASEQVEKDSKVFSRLKKIGFDVFVSDEADLARNVDAQRTEAVIELANVCKYYVELTGTPIPNSPRDVVKTLYLMTGKWSRAGFVPDNPLDSYFASFENNPTLLSTVLHPHLLRRKLSETAELDCKLFTKRVFVSLDDFPAQREAYFAVLAERRGGEQKLSLLHKISLDPQLAGAEFYSGPNGKSAKYSKLFEFLDLDLRKGRKAVVYTVFKDGVTRRGYNDPSGPILIEQLQDRYQAVRAIDGDVSNQERETILNEFRFGDTNVLLLTAQAMGRGLDLSCASRVYHLQKTYLPDDRDQQDARLYRRGQRNNVFSYSFILRDPSITDSGVAGSIDEGIEALLETKRFRGELFLMGARGWTPEQLQELFSKVISLKGYM